MSDLVRSYTHFQDVAAHAILDTNANRYNVSVCVQYDNAEFFYVVADDYNSVSLNCDTTNNEELTEAIYFFTNANKAGRAIDPGDIKRYTSLELNE